MANVIHRTTLQFIPSANTPDYPEPTWKHDPDMSAVAGVAFIYWKWDGATERPVPMTQGERDAVDSSRLATARDASAAGLTQVENILRAVVLVVLDEINALRSSLSLAARTENQVRAAIRNKLGT